MRKLMVPGLLGLIGFALALFILSGGAEPPKRSVVQLLNDKNPGDVIKPEDVRLVALEAQYTRQSALERLEDAVGKTVVFPRKRGDILTKEDVDTALPFEPNTRLVGLKVSLDDALAGLLKRGDKVTLIASIPMEGGYMGTAAYTKAFIDSLTVFYVSPQLAPAEAIQEQTGQQGGVAFSVAMQRQQAQEGVVVLAVPVDPVPVYYITPNKDVFSVRASSEISIMEQIEFSYEARLVSPVEFIAALKSLGAKFTLALIPPGQEGGEFARKGSMGILLESYIPAKVQTAIPRTQVIPGGEGK
ncbi:MAG: SAF domain-containing protein [Candidatus Hadarchaeales archaeon]